MSTRAEKQCSYCHHSTIEKTEFPFTDGPHSTFSSRFLCSHQENPQLPPLCPRFLHGLATIEKKVSFKHLSFPFRALWWTEYIARSFVEGFRACLRVFFTGPMPYKR